MAMRRFFTAMWRTILLRGIASLVFGVFAMFYPGITLAVVVTIFGIYALVDGLLGLWGIFNGRAEGSSMTSFLVALAGIAAGLICLVFPAFATTYVVLLIGFWNFAAGVLQLAGAFALRNDIENPMLLGLSGLIGAALGILIVFYPENAAISIIWIIAGTAVLVGLVLIAFGWKLRGAAKQFLTSQGA